MNKKKSSNPPIDTKYKKTRLKNTNFIIVSCLLCLKKTKKGCKTPLK